MYISPPRNGAVICRQQQTRGFVPMDVCTTTPALATDATTFFREAWEALSSVAHNCPVRCACRRTGHPLLEGYMLCCFRLGRGCFPGYERTEVPPSSDHCKLPQALSVVYLRMDLELMSAGRQGSGAGLYCTRPGHIPGLDSRSTKVVQNTRECITKRHHVVQKNFRHALQTLAAIPETVTPYLHTYIVTLSSEADGKKG